MRFALMTEPQQGYSYQDILDMAPPLRRLGFETFFRSDHYSSFPGRADLPTTDAWTTLAGLARDTDAHRPGHDGLAGHLPHPRLASPRSSPRSTR